MSYIIAVDFDGTLCENKYPEIGEPRKDVIDYLKNKQQDEAKLILWSCRVNELLDNAVCWCRNQGLIFDAVNENLPEIIAEFGTDTRKIFANEYIDDRNVRIPEKEYDTLVCTAVRKDPYEFVNILNEAAKTAGNLEPMLREAACVIANLLEVRDISEPKKEMNDKDDTEYECRRICNASTFETYKNLSEDECACFSSWMSERVCEILVKGKYRILIEDTDDIWEEAEEFYIGDNSYTSYQCKRLRTLFKNVYDDGRVKYEDISRFIGFYQTTNVTCYSEFINKVLNEMYPITMPYTPANKPYKVICAEWLTSRKNGDSSDTIGIFSVEEPDGKIVNVDRYFKKDGFSWKKISAVEYSSRIIDYKEREKRGGIDG